MFNIIIIIISQKGSLYLSVDAETSNGVLLESTDKGFSQALLRLPEWFF